MTFVHWLGLTVFLVGSACLWWGCRQNIHVLMDTGTGERVRRKATRRLVRAAAIWECTIAVMVLMMNGWSSLANALAMVGTGVFLMVIPKLTEW